MTCTLLLQYYNLEKEKLYNAQVLHTGTVAQQQLLCDTANTKKVNELKV